MPTKKNSAAKPATSTQPGKREQKCTPASPTAEEIAAMNAATVAGVIANVVVNL